MSKAPQLGKSLGKIRILGVESLLLFKGQIKPKADRRAIDSPKNRMDEFGFYLPRQSGNTENLKFGFQVLSICVKKKQTNYFVWFLGESTARQSAYGFI